MLSLNLNWEPRWIELSHPVRTLVQSDQNRPVWVDRRHPIRVQVKPMTTAVMAAARSAAAREVLPQQIEDADLREGAIKVAFARALAAYSITAWEGLTDSLTPNNARALMEVSHVAEAFLASVDRLAEALLKVADEGNASGSAPNG